jgi:glucose-1-phosphate cytidylyltransferase
VKVIILAGGFGTRISEETEQKPKPMVTIGGIPIIHHLMKIYALNGITEFVIACGYKKEVIFQWIEQSDFGRWSVQAIDTGLETQTAGRIRKCMELLPNQDLLVSYGDGLGNVDIQQSIELFRKTSAYVVVTAVRPPARFGLLQTQGTMVTRFAEKDQTQSDWINGGFFVISHKVKDFIQADSESFEFTTIPKMAQLSKVHAFFHDGFWKPMDTLREKNELEELAKLFPPPWINSLGKP